MNFDQFVAFTVDLQKWGYFSLEVGFVTYFLFCLSGVRDGMGMSVGRVKPLCCALVFNLDGLT